MISPTHVTHLHPEAEMHEVFIANMNVTRFLNIPLASKRSGAITYNGSGERLAVAYDWRPVFASYEEVGALPISLQKFRRLYVTKGQSSSS